MSSSTHMSAETLLTSLVDLRLTLNDSHRVQEITSDSELLRHLFRDTLIGRPWLELVRDSDSSVAQEALRLAQAEPGSAHRADVALISGPEEEPIPVTCWLCASHETSAVQVACIDLRGETNLRQQLVNAQIALEQDYEAQRDNDLKLRALMAVMDEPMLFVSVRSGNVIDANAAAADLFGRKASDLTGAGFHTMVEGKGPGGLIDKLVSVAASQSGGPVKATATGQHTPIHLSPKMLRTSQDQILLCKLSSPTIVRASNDTLTDNLSDLFDNGVDAMVFAAQDGTVLSTNTAFLKLADVAHPQNVQGQSLSQFLARGSVDMGVIIGNAKRSGAMRLYATKIKSELGTDRPVEISTTRLRASDTPVYALIIRDASRVEAIRPGSSNVADVDMRSVIEYIGNQSLKDIVAQTTDVVEKMCIETAVEMTSNNRVAAAEMLGLSRQSLYVKLRKYGLVKKD